MPILDNPFTWSLIYIFSVLLLLFLSFMAAVYIPFMDNPGTILLSLIIPAAVMFPIQRAYYQQRK